VLFIDDHSRNTWIYFLKTKDGVLVIFQEFKAHVENLTDRKIKVPGQIWEESTPPWISMISALRQGSRGSTPFLITLNRMGLQRVRIDLLLRQPKR
jgi:hypothetical protein